MTQGRKQIRSSKRFTTNDSERVEGQRNEARQQWLDVFLSSIQLSAIVTAKNKQGRKRKK